MFKPPQNWEQTKKRYWASKLPKNCHICDSPPHSGMNLHHLTYERYGHEHLNDLVPVCHKCHQDIHSMQRRNPGMTIKEATRKTRLAYRKNTLTRVPRATKKVRASFRKYKASDYDKYINSGEWDAKKREFWDFYKKRNCYCCDSSSKPLDVHHRSYDYFGNERMQDLVPVCRECHVFIHSIFKKSVGVSLWDATEEARGWFQGLR